MTVNSYLNSPSAGRSPEQDLMEDLIIESIQASGMDLWFFRKDQLNLDELFKESTSNKYKTGFQVEMYMTDVINFNGDGDMFSAFGLVSTDQCTLQVSQTRFKQECIQAKDGNFVPLEDDLIYMPHSKTLWRIRKVKQDPEYLKFGKNYVWRLDCATYDPTGEEFEGREFTQGDLGHVLSDESIDGMSKVLGIKPTDQQNPDLGGYGQDALAPSFDKDNPFGEC